MDSIMTTDFKSYGTGYRGHYFAPLLGRRSILTVDGQEWKSRRAMTRSILDRSRVDDLRSIEMHTTRLIEAVDGA